MARDTIIPRVLDPQDPAFLQWIVENARKYTVGAQTDCVPLANLGERAKSAAIWEKHFHDEPKTWERFALEVFGEPAGFVDAIIAGVHILEAYRYPAKKIPQEHAIAAYERSANAARQTTGEVRYRGGDQKSEDRKSIANFAIDSQRERAKESGISHYTQRKLDWLARKAPKQLARVQRGEVSVHRACIQAGHIKEVTPLQAGIRAWNRMSSEEREQFLAFIKDDSKKAA